MVPICFNLASNNPITLGGGGIMAPIDSDYWYWGSRHWWQRQSWRMIKNVMRWLQNLWNRKSSARTNYYWKWRKILYIFFIRLHPFHLSFIIYIDCTMCVWNKKCKEFPRYNIFTNKLNNPWKKHLSILHSQTNPLVHEYWVIVMTTVASTINYMLQVNFPYNNLCL